MMSRFESAWLLAQQAQPLIRRLDPQTRAKVLAALAGLVILGFALIAFVWLAGRATRRYMGVTKEPDHRPNSIQPDDWAHKPLVPPLDEPPSSNS